MGFPGQKDADGAGETPDILQGLRQERGYNQANLDAATDDAVKEKWKRRIGEVDAEIARAEAAEAPADEPETADGQEPVETAAPAKPKKAPAKKS